MYVHDTLASVYGWGKEKVLGKEPEKITLKEHEEKDSDSEEESKEQSGSNYY